MRILSSSTKFSASRPPTTSVQLFGHNGHYLSYSTYRLGLWPP